jgi:hypothetical protein
MANYRVSTNTNKSNMITQEKRRKTTKETVKSKKSSSA